MSIDFDNKKIAVFVVAHNRPQMLKKVLDSIENSPELENIPFYFFLDGGDIADQQGNCQVIDKFKFSNKTIIKASVSYGCARNTFNAFNQVFCEEQYEYAFHVEDDFQYGKNYFKWAYAQFKHIKESVDANIGVFQGFSNCVMSPEEKKFHLNEIEKCNFNYLWGCLYSREGYLNIKNALYEYEKLVNLIPTDGTAKNYLFKFKDPSVKDIYNKLIDECKFNLLKNFKDAYYTADEPDKEVTVGWDGAFTVALHVSNTSRYQSTVNRMKNIGNIGLHFTNDLFEEYGLHKINLDEVW